MRRVGPAEVPGTRRDPVEAQALADVVPIIESVRTEGTDALSRHSKRLGDGPVATHHPNDLAAAFDSLPENQKEALKAAADRVTAFAQAQRNSVSDLATEVVGGRAGHRWIPVDVVGAYAPGGRHPLPSSVLMTAIPARVAGVVTVWVASPRPAQVTLAAAHVAGADGLLAAGGAQAVAALAFGTMTPACDLIVGPGNKWVTAAKKYLYGEVGIDGLAGPSEIMVIADESADPVLVAADLLAQAEHDVVAVPWLVTTSTELADAVDVELSRQLADLPTAPVASRALDNGFTCVVGSMDEAAALSDRLGPEHLALHVSDPRSLQLNSYGSLFSGHGAAETFADYGVGPNHVLPTGGAARYQSGLSVFTYLKTPTWLQLDDPSPLIDETALLARLEGLEAHARAALWRGSRD